MRIKGLLGTVTRRSAQLVPLFKKYLLSYSNIASNSLDNLQVTWYDDSGQEKSPRKAVAAASESFPREIIVMHDYDTRHLVICQRGLVLFEEGGQAHAVLR